MNKQDNGVFYAIAVIVIVILVLTFMLLTNPEAAQVDLTGPLYLVEGCTVDVRKPFTDFRVSNGWIYIANPLKGYITMIPAPDCLGSVRAVN